MLDTKNISGGFVAMVMSILGLVLFVSVFDKVLEALESIRIYEYLSTFLVMDIVVVIVPSILLLAGTAAAGFGYWKGFQSLEVSGKDEAGIMRMLLSAVGIILFFSMFLTILTSFYGLYSADNASEYLVFQTVVTILPTILFLSGTFAFGMTFRSGYKAAKDKARSKTGTNSSAT